MSEKFVTGRVFIKCNGGMIPLKGNVKVTPCQFVKEAVVGLNGLEGFKETFVPARLECQAVANKSFDLEALQKETDLKITCTTNDGASFSITGASLTGEYAYDLVEGTVDLVFTGSTCVKL